MTTTDQELTAVADANGNARVSITPYRRQVWTVTQVSIEAPTAPSTAVATVRRGNFAITPVVAHADAASGDPPVILRPGQRLTVEWSNLNAGDEVRALIIYDDGEE